MIFVVASMGPSCRTAYLCGADGSFSCDIEHALTFATVDEAEAARLADHYPDDNWIEDTSNLGSPVEPTVPTTEPPADGGQGGTP